MELLDESEVFLVSEDKAFYRDRNYNHGLAINLMNEMEKYSNKLHLFANLNELLQYAKKTSHRVWTKT